MFPRSIFRRMTSGYEDILLDLGVYKERIKENKVILDKIPGPKGLPYVGTLFEYFSKKSGFTNVTMYLALNNAVLHSADVDQNQLTSLCKDFLYTHIRVLTGAGIHTDSQFQICQNSFFLLDDVSKINFQKDDEWAQMKRKEVFGKVYREIIGGNDAVYITDITSYDQVLRNEGAIVYRMPLEPMTRFCKETGIDVGLTNAYGNYWKSLKDILYTCMLNQKNIEHFAGLMNYVADELVESIIAQRKENLIVQNLGHLIAKWALDSASTFIFNQTIGSLKGDEMCLKFIHHVFIYFSTIHDLLYSSQLYKYFPTKVWKESVTNGIALRKLKASHLKDQETAQYSIINELSQYSQLSEDFIEGYLVDIMMGSIETTRYSITWLLYNLSKNADCQEKIYFELKSLLKERKYLTASDISQLHYMRCCLKESFRLCPVAVCTSRVLAKDITVEGYLLPKGTHVMGSLFGMGRDSRIFEKPDEFIPERWLESGNVEAHKLNSIQMGHGARKCPGRRIASQEIFITLAKITMAFKIKSHNTVNAVMKPLLMPNIQPELEFIPR